MSPRSALLLQTQPSSSSPAARGNCHSTGKELLQLSHEPRAPLYGTQQKMPKPGQKDTRKLYFHVCFNELCYGQSMASHGKGNQLVFIQTKYKDTFTYPTADNLPGEEETELALQKSIINPCWYKRPGEFSCGRKDAAKERCKTTGGKQRCSS